MGLAASQARLLSITSRLSDNELRAQLINNKKIRLASESSRASEDYVNALNHAKMMFTNYDASNNSVTQNLTFNALTSYSQYNTQYGISDMNGNLLVSEYDAMNFKNSTDLTSFLAKYGLTQDTTFFKSLAQNEAGGKVILTKDSDGNVTSTSDYSATEISDIYFGKAAAPHSTSTYDEILTSKSYTNVQGEVKTISANLDPLESYAYKGTKETLLFTDSQTGGYDPDSTTNLSALKTLSANLNYTDDDPDLAYKYSKMTQYYKDIQDYFNLPSVAARVNKSGLIKTIQDTLQENALNVTYNASTAANFSTNATTGAKTTNINGTSGTTTTVDTFDQLKPEFQWTQANGYQLDYLDQSGTSSVSDSLTGTTQGTAQTQTYTKDSSGTYTLNDGSKFAATKNSDGTWSVSATDASGNSLSNCTYDGSSFIYQSLDTASGITGSGATVNKVPIYTKVSFDGSGTATLTSSTANCSMASHIITSASSDTEHKFNSYPYSVTTTTITNPFDNNDYTTETNVQGIKDDGGTPPTSYSNLTVSSPATTTSGTGTDEYYETEISNMKSTIADVITYFFTNLAGNVNFENPVILDDLTNYDKRHPEDLIKDSFTTLLANQHTALDTLASEIFTPASIASIKAQTGYSAPDNVADYYSALGDLVQDDDGDGTYELDENNIKQGQLKYNSSKTVTGLVYNTSSPYNTQEVLDVMDLNAVFKVYGDPKITWIDSDKSDTNPDAKVKWYTNLYDRMQKGYKTLLNGLASSSDWMEYAFESSLVKLEQVNNVNEWSSTTYSNCSTISEQTDDLAVTKAEAEYKSATNKIQAKDQKLDMELKNIDTEHNSLQTEYDSIKTAIDKNIEKSFKMYS